MLGARSTIIKNRVPSTEHRAPSTEHRAPSTEQFNTTSSQQKTNIMKQLVTIIAFTLILGCKEDKKAAPSIADNMKTYTIEQMMDNEAVGGGSFSPDKSKMLLSSNRSGIYNMYTVPTSGGEMTPITQSDSSSVFGISYFPKDERMLFRMDGNGDEIYHIYLRDTDGSHKDLTPDEGKRANFYGWTDDKKGFFYTSNIFFYLFVFCHNCI